MTQAAQVTGISHISLVVTDLERSTEFYCDALGIKQDGSPFIVDDDASANLWGLDRERGRHKVVLLSCGGIHFTLVRFDETDVTQRAAPSENVGLSHFGFWVSDVDDLYDRLTKRGVQFAGPPYTTGFVEAYGAPMRVARLSDPDGIAIEVYALVK